MSQSNLLNEGPNSRVGIERSLMATLRSQETTHQDPVTGLRWSECQITRACGHNPPEPVRAYGTAAARYEQFLAARLLECPRCQRSLRRETVTSMVIDLRGGA